MVGLDPAIHAVRLMTSDGLAHRHVLHAPNRRCPGAVDGPIKSGHDV